MTHELPPSTVVLVLVWSLCLGGTIGSFLNVVVWRLPRGMNLAWPGSHCPRCRHAIRWYDNIPVLGWLRLGGRCRDCGAPIAPRYPLVEGVTAAAFLALTTLEFAAGGPNLPPPGVPLPGAGPNLPWPLFPRVALCVLHLFLLSTLFPIALIVHDRLVPPWRVGWPALVVGVAAAVAAPWIHPLPALRGLSPETTGWFNALAGLGTGAAAAALLAPLLGQAQRRALLIGLPLVGLYLGWHAALAVAAALGGLQAVGRSLSVALPRAAGRLTAATAPAMWLLLLTAAWIALWRPILAALAVAA